MTLAVIIDDEGVIVEGPSIVRKFTGQPIENLIRWMRKLGGFKMEILA